MQQKETTLENTPENFLFPHLTEGKNTFSLKYDLRWQEELAYIIFTDSLFAEQIREVLEIDFFDDSALRILVKSFFMFRQVYQEYPELNMFVVYFNLMEKSPLTIRAKEILDNFLIKERSINADFVKDSALRFCKYRKLDFAIRKIAGKISEKMEDSDYEEVVSLISSTARLANIYDRGHIYKDHIAMRYANNRREPITTGITLLDGYTNGGLSKGELGLVIGGTGGGKSMFLAWLASRALMAGKNVIYYTLELSEADIAKRIDASLLNCNIGATHNYIDVITRKMSDLKGNLIIKEYPTKNCTVETIVSHIERERSLGNKPDLVLLDYLDLLRFSSKYTELRHNLQNATEEMRGVAKRYDVAVWTASQTNRDGYNSTTPGLEHISEAFSKVFATDLTVTIGRTEKEKKAGKAFYKIAKNRNGVDGVVFIGDLNTSNVQITFDAVVDEEEIIKTKNEAYKKELNTVVSYLNSSSEIKDISEDNPFF